tara:strand:+ start:354 stop:719 length:366 start_codon:yes stop_codon:yes gene_type:complete
MIIAILSVIIGAAGGNKSEDDIPSAALSSATSTTSSNTPSTTPSAETAQADCGGPSTFGGIGYPTGYYDFFPDPRDFTFEEYILAVEEYAQLHEIKEREEEAAFRACKPYEFKELFTADRV